MSKFIVVVFKDEPMARKGANALETLHEGGSIAVYSAAIVARNTDGQLAIRDAAEEGPRGTVLGGLLGGLIRVIQGPAGTAAGATGSGLPGNWNDLLKLGIDDDFLNQAASRLTAGKAAVVAEIDEYVTSALDISIEALGGVAVRKWRTDFEDERIEQDMHNCELELAEIKAEHARAEADAKAKLQARIDEARAKLSAISDRAKARIEGIKQQSDAKIKTLQDQVSEVRQDKRARIAETIAKVRGERDRRAQKLSQAWSLTKEALGKKCGGSSFSRHRFGVKHIIQTGV